MTVDTLRDKFLYHLEEMYYVERLHREELENVRSDLDTSNLREEIEHHHEQTSDQIGRIEEVFDILDEPPRERSSPAFDALYEEGERFLERGGSDDDMRDLHELNAAVKAEHIEIAGYENLIMLARKLEMKQDIRRLLGQNLEEEKQAKKRLKALADDSSIRSVFARLAG